MPFEGSPYRSALTADTLRKIPNQPGSALRAAKVDANLWTEIRFSLDRVCQGKGFYLCQSGPRKLDNVWLLIASVFFDNFCYYQRASKAGHINLDALPKSADTLITTVLQEQATGTSIKNRSHYKKLSENVITKLINLYDIMSTCVLEIEKSQTNNQRFFAKALCQEELKQVIEEIHFVRYKISGWLLNWRVMIKFDQKIEQRLDKIAANIHDIVEVMRHSSDPEISDQYYDYARKKALISAFDDIDNSNHSTSSRSESTMQVSEDGVTCIESVACSISTSSKEQSDQGDLSSRWESIERSSLSDQDTTSIEDSEGSINQGVDEKDDTASEDGVSSDQEHASDQSDTCQSAVAQRAIVYATRDNVLKRSRGECFTDGETKRSRGEDNIFSLENDHEVMPMPGGLFDAKLGHCNDIVQVSKEFKMVNSEEQHLEQQLLTLQECDELNNKLSELAKRELPLELVTVKVFSGPNKPKNIPLDIVCGWPSSLGKGFYVPKSINAALADTYSSGEVRLVSSNMQSGQLKSAIDECAFRPFK